MVDQLALDFSTGLDVRVESPAPWIPSAAAAHVVGLSKALNSAGHGRFAIIAAYEAEIARLRNGSTLQPVTDWRAGGVIAYDEKQVNLTVSAFDE
ncbi:hypothetical protein ACFFV8_02475 [Sphingobium indicum]|uniref:Uncharacterized protein n=1 Tax=Sphingobium quisquiliarum P25 TaxID=1329909 RepID=T0GEB0_9SPHN|nr:hypothetical protein [Sphingobium quisquiliarum]EQA98362.1 hypothetical protein L288_20520 [Sphingobium quisquiliarum P25]